VPNWTNWKLGQPDNSQGDEDAVESDATVEGLWNDIPITTGKNFVKKKSSFIT
jgi:hypothetical protein